MQSSKIVLLKLPLGGLIAASLSGERERERLKDVRARVETKSDGGLGFIVES